MMAKGPFTATIKATGKAKTLVTELTHTDLTYRRLGVRRAFATA